MACMVHNIYTTYYNYRKSYEKRIKGYKFIGILLLFFMYLCTIFHLQFTDDALCETNFSLLLYDLAFIRIFYLVGLGTIVYILHKVYFIIKKNHDYLTLNQKNLRDTNILMLFNALLTRYLNFIGYFLLAYIPVTLIILIKYTLGFVGVNMYILAFLSMLLISFHAAFSVIIKLTDPLMMKYLKRILFGNKIHDYSNIQNRDTLNSVLDLDETQSGLGVSLLHYDQEEYTKMCHIASQQTAIEMEFRLTQGTNTKYINSGTHVAINEKHKTPTTATLNKAESFFKERNRITFFPQNNTISQFTQIDSSSENNNDTSFDLKSVGSAHADNIHNIYNFKYGGSTRKKNYSKSHKKGTFDLLNFHIDISENILRMVAITVSINEDRKYDGDSFYEKKFTSQLPWKEDKHYIEKTGWHEYTQKTLPDWVAVKNHARFTSIKVRIKKFCPLVFHHIRKIDKVTIDDCIKSLNPIQNLIQKHDLQVSGGRGDYSILSTWDKKLMIKTISKQEKQLLKRDMIKEYHERMRDTKSLLGRIYGLFKIEINDSWGIHVLLMKNMRDLPLSTQYLTFDLKGSTVDRQCISAEDQKAIQSNSPNRYEVISQYREKVLKDKDFSLLGIKLNLYSNDAKNLEISVTNDSYFLQKFYVTDYSLLVFIHMFTNEDRYTHYANLRIMPSVDHKFLFNFAIIDFLGIYDLERKGEKLGKDLMSLVKMRDDTNFSVQNPERYGTRFRTILKNIVETPEND